MTVHHEERGFIDNSRIDCVAVRAYEKPTLTGKLIFSQKRRSTELLAEVLYELWLMKQKAQEATDTQGEWKVKGLKQCKICGIAKNKAKEFRHYHQRGVEYVRGECRDCESAGKRNEQFEGVAALIVASA